MPAGDGVRSATRGVLRLGSGATRAAFIKRMDRPAVMAEAFSALLLRAWGLSVPDPFLVAEGTQLAFASASAEYPSLKHRLGVATMPDGPIKDAITAIGCQIVAALDETPLALAADEAIDNRDRNFGNILWDGTRASWIDHERTLGLAASLADTNKLAQAVQRTAAWRGICARAIAGWMALDRTHVQHAADCAPADCTVFAQYVAARLTLLGNRIIARFPVESDLLSGA